MPGSGYRLLVVESPGKIKKLSSFLGNGWRVEATIGHIRDLPETDLGLCIEDGTFKPTYRIIPGKENVVKRLKTAVAGASEVFLASDPDREGEAIAYHVLGICKKEAANKKVFRVTFNSITKAAVLAAVASPRALDDELIEAQKARRATDRLVGFKVSAMASKLLSTRGLTAGRVQTVCLRFVVDREREIRAFVASKYWTVDTVLSSDSVTFPARLWVSIKKGDDKLDPTQNFTKEQAEQLVRGMSGVNFWVKDVTSGEKSRRPQPPFTTSTLQQAASRGLEFSPEKTMELAQRLYEGGLITYMRTDAVVVAPEAQEEARGYIAETFGADYVPHRSQEYATKAANAQEAHECIRPTHVAKLANEIDESFDNDSVSLYELIWRRFLASQMADARYFSASVNILAGKENQAFPLEFRAQGRVPLFDGFLKLYHEPVEEEEENEEDQLSTLPSLAQGQALDFVGWNPEEHTTKAPSRFTEASLIQILERSGVGRPSTYASMVAHIKKHGYVRIEKKRLVPTDVGFALCDLLVEKFGALFAYDYTANLEALLDEIAGGKVKYVPALTSVWNKMYPLLEAVGQELEIRRQEQLAAIKINEPCPKCGEDLVKRQSTHGEFIGCSGFPNCTYSRGVASRPVRVVDSSGVRT